MAKNPNSRPRPAKREEPMNGAMKFFLAGCVAELYLLIIRRFYINGTIDQVVAWDSYLIGFAWAGVAVAAVGAVLSVLWRADRKKRKIGWVVLGAGVFLAAVSAVVRINLSVLTLLYVAVPVVMLLGILWSLYDRECAVALTILGVSLLAMWALRREVTSIYTGTYFKALTVVYLLLIAAHALWRVRPWLPAVSWERSSFCPPVRIPCRSMWLADCLPQQLVTVLINSLVSYYAMWILAGVIFALAVYYTVKQL